MTLQEFTVDESFILVAIWAFLIYLIVKWKDFYMVSFATMFNIFMCFNLYINDTTPLYDNVIILLFGMFMSVVGFYRVLRMAMT